MFWRALPPELRPFELTGAGSARSSTSGVAVIQPGVFLMRVVLVLVFVSSAAFAQIPLPTAPTWMSAETALYGTGLDIGDIDGNGWLDLAVSNGNDMALSPTLVYLNQAGTLPTTASWASNDLRYSGHCQLADLDDDGFPELMVSNYITPGWGPAQVQVYDNVGGVLELLPSWESPADIHTFRASFGDPDGDGDLDLAVATGEAYNGFYEPNLVFFNVDGVLEATASWSTTVSDACYDAKFVDYDGDGDQDLAFLGGGTSGRVTIYENSGGVLATTASYVSALNDNGNTFDFDDLDADGRLDMVVGFNTQLSGSGNFAAFLTAGGNLPTTPTWRSDFAGYGSAVVCADLDGRNGPDLVTGGWWQPVRVYLNDGGGGFAANPDWQTAVAWESVVENICFADLDEGRTRNETAFIPVGVSVFEVPHRHLQGIDGLWEGETELNRDAWCSSLRDGWISLAEPAGSPIRVEYRASDGLDLAISNWDDATFVFHSMLPTAAPEAAPTVALAEVRAWPNPFNPRTTFGLRLTADLAAARLRVYDLRGRLIETLHDGALAAGDHRFVWQPRQVASGVYLYRLEGGGQVVTGKVVLAK